MEGLALVAANALAGRWTAGEYHHRTRRAVAVEDREDQALISRRQVENACPRQGFRRTCDLGSVVRRIGDMPLLLREPIHTRRDHLAG
jgi:hypothetical protein